MPCDYRTIQKATVTVCYFVYLIWAYLKLQFKDEEGFIDVANRVDVIIAVSLGLLLRLTYGLGQTLREVSDALPLELSQRFDSMFMLNKRTDDAVTRMAEDIANISRAQSLAQPHNDPFELSIPGPSVTSDESMHVLSLDDGRRVELRIPRRSTEPPDVVSSF